jgi:hypothetical protein
VIDLDLGGSLFQSLTCVDVKHMVSFDTDNRRPTSSAKKDARSECTCADFTMLFNSVT